MFGGKDTEAELTTRNGDHSKFVPAIANKSASVFTLWAI